MKISHFIITPFCIRNPEALRRARGGGWEGREDPLLPSFLNVRLKLLEILSSAAVHGQTDPDSTWVVVIDPDLPQEFRLQLREIGGPDRVILCEYDPAVRFDSLGWLAPFMDGRPDFVVTTQLDDDDSFSRTHVEVLRKSVISFASRTEEPLIRIFGTGRIWQWNMVPTRNAPLGFRSDWPGENPVSSCGFSVACRFPELSLSILGLRHKRARNYLDFSVGPADESVTRFRDRLTEQFPMRDQDYGSEDSGFEELSERTGPVVMANHGRNVQRHRLFRQAVDQLTVTGPEAFPNHCINWEAAERYMPHLRLSLRDRWKVGWQRIRG